jgi:hypothetical protein
MDIGGPYFHFLDCLKEGTTFVAPLVWRMGESKTRFITSIEETDIIINGTTNVKRLVLTPFGGSPIGVGDLGTYTCQDTSDGETLSVVLAQGLQRL